MTYSHGTCAICNERHDFLMALHGDKGGPMACLLCSGKWHAEHGKRRRLGRIVIRAMMAFMEAGGKSSDIDKLRNAATFANVGGLETVTDPLGYLAGIASSKDEVIELTSETLDDTVKLVHPDCHPPERKELATRVSAQLIALKPFVFPAPKPKPPPTYSPATDNKSAVSSRAATAKSLRYPCTECASTIPAYYCSACKAEWDKSEGKRLEEERKKHLRQLKRRRQLRADRRLARTGKCAVCGEWFKGRRRDALFCSDACRQQAHRKPSQDAERVRAHSARIRDTRLAKLARLPVTMCDGKLYINSYELTLDRYLHISNGRVQFKSGNPFGPRHKHCKVTFTIDGRATRLRLQMCDDCQTLFAAHQIAWLCDPCAKAHKDKAVAKRRAQRQSVTDKQHPAGVAACSRDERREASP
jgi:hypothetical protein